MLLVRSGDGRNSQDGSNPSLISRRVNIPESSITLVRASSMKDYSSKYRLKAIVIPSFLRKFFQDDNLFN
jgi:hypothetical protein